jgi:hypothetical protein
LIGSVDLSRVIRELKALDDWLNQAALRSGGKAMTMPKTSVTLDELSRLNGVSLLEAKQREQLIMLLEGFATHAPRIHISFAVEPSGPFSQRIATWFRANVSPIALIDIGLQPTLVAGCSVRTNNKIFDMSLRHRFYESRKLLVQSIAGVKGE